MASKDVRATPRVYFLNEQHELAQGEKSGFGSTKAYLHIDWAQKGTRLHKGLISARKAIAASPDPLKDSRYFVLVAPEKKLIQPTKSKKSASTERERKVAFGGSDSDVFRRLGLDLLGIDGAGNALVHATVDRFDQVLASSQRLDQESVRERARWAPIAEIGVVPRRLRLDEAWLNKLRPGRPVSVVFELQPVLKSIEADLVAKAMVELGRSVSPKGFSIVAAGSDVSGRRWYRGEATPECVGLIADGLQSIQRIHQPFRTPLGVTAHRTAPQSVSQQTPTASQSLPRVVVADAGVPQAHPQLGPFRTGGYTAPDGPTEAMASHGSHVASRVVFGDVPSSGLMPLARCRFFDVNIVDPLSQDPNRPNIEDQTLVSTFEVVAGMAPDARVFNLSMGAVRPLSLEGEVDRLEKLQKLRDLDNFAFRRDALVVVAAGNSPPGQSPTGQYPEHFDEPDWGLGVWACGFNTLTVGSYVDPPSPAGLAKTRGAPSPFTRVGPAPIADAPVIDFSASGGDCSSTWRSANGLGVGAYNADGLWEDVVGTSFAAPLVSREAAIVLAELAKRCPPGVRASAALGRAVLTMAARRPKLSARRLEQWAERTLGGGLPSSALLEAPVPEVAHLLWQGILQDAKHTSRLRVPVPLEWMKKSDKPTVRVVVAWMSPVNDAYTEGWACRKVSAQVRNSGGTALGFESQDRHRSYPVIDRRYPLRGEQNELLLDESEFTLEISYEQKHEEPIGPPFTSETRVGVAIELVDDVPNGLAPHEALQSHVLIGTLATRLSLAVPSIAVPVKAGI